MQSNSDPLPANQDLQINQSKAVSVVDIIQLDSDVDTQPVPSTEKLASWGEAALEGLEHTFALRIVSSDQMRDLNSTFANNRKATNVLSFPSQLSLSDLPEAMHTELEDQIGFLGDIALCAEVVNNEALAQGKTQDAHWAHMIVHGVLHLRGFDHITATDAQQMEAHEVRLLNALGFDDPYAEKT